MSLSENQKQYLLEVQKREVVQRAKKWAAQGSRSMWTSPTSLALYDAVTELEGMEENNAPDDSPTTQRSR